MKYLKQYSIAALMATSSIFLSSCAQQNRSPSSPSEMTGIEHQLTNNAKAVTVDEALAKGDREIQLSVGQDLWINPNNQINQWRVSLGRHDFAKVLIETNPQKIQSKMSFNAPGQYRLTLNSIASSNSQGGAAPNVIQQQITIIVKDQ